jgi:hypothetical protein
MDIYMCVCYWSLSSLLVLTHSTFNVTTSTPEMHAWLEQLSVLGCRLVDAAASGTNKQLIHGVYELVWSGVEVLADPQSTLALAEVTAYLCHALEMEDALPRPDDGNATRQNATRRYQRNSQQSQTYGTQTQVLQDPDATVEQVILSSLGNVHANTIGGEDAANGNGINLDIPSNVVFHDMDNGDAQANANTNATSSLDWNHQPQIQIQNQVNIPYLQQKMEKRAQQLRQENRRTPTTTITASNPLSSTSSPLLKTPPVATKQSSKGGGLGSTSSSQITAATNASSFKPSTPTISNLQNNAKNENGNKTDTKDENHMDMEDLVVLIETETTTVEEDDDDRTKPAPKPRPHESEDPVVSSQHDQQHPKQHRLKGEMAVMQFYRILDEVLQEKRETRINELLGSVNGDGDVDVDIGPPQSWYSRAAATAGPGNERGQDTMKRRLASLKKSQLRAASTAGNASETGVGSSAFTAAAAAAAKSTWPNLRDFVNQRRPPKATTKSKAITDLMAIYHQYKSIILVGVGVASFMAWMVSAFAMYGMYIFFFPAGLGWTSIPLLGGLFSSSSTASHATSSSEIVIRVIREVVHVNQDGTVLNRLVTDPIASAATSATENLDRIAQCVAAALD